MGWLSYSNTGKQAVVRQIKLDYDATTQWSLVGNNLWALYTVSQKDVDYNPNNVLGQKVILLFRLEYFKNDKGYGYKDMCESMHPYQYNCPLKFLKEATVTCQQWRDEVIKYHADKARINKKVKEICIGDLLTLRNCSVKEVRVTDTAPLRGRCTRTNILYRIPKTYLSV
jgi:hypothetical protein